jgi:hypothetical protein
LKIWVCDEADAVHGQSLLWKADKPLPVLKL